MRVTTGFLYNSKFKQTNRKSYYSCDFSTMPWSLNSQNGGFKSPKPVYSATSAAVTQAPYAASWSAEGVRPLAGG
ncbi:hypothetical protein MTO96_013402 [Rhipicephalus appendiculatus]